MANTLLIIGESGVGKSHSLQNLNPEETLIIAPNSKPLPWQGSGKTFVDGKNVIRITELKQVPMLVDKAAQGSKFKTVIIEDFTHLLNQRMMDPSFANSTSWSKWNHMASDAYQALLAKHETYRKDLNIVVIAHSDVKENGAIGMRTSGKLLDNTIDIVSYFTVVLHARILRGDSGLRYVFQTHNDGQYICKSPVGMFQDDFVANDLQQVLTNITNYYNA